MTPTAIGSCAKLAKVAAALVAIDVEAVARAATWVKHGQSGLCIGETASICPVVVDVDDIYVARTRTHTQTLCNKRIHP